MAAVTSVRNKEGLIGGNIHSFAVESFSPLPSATLGSIFIGFDSLNGKTSAELNFSRDLQTSYELGGVLHLYFPSEMMGEIREFLKSTVPSAPTDPSFAVINFKYSDPSSTADRKAIDPGSISLVDRRWCR